MEKGKRGGGFVYFCAKTELPKKKSCLLHVQKEIVLTESADYL